MQRRFIQCDVFSDRALKGNGLAVVLDAEGMSDVQMLEFAQWTQQAETTFVTAPVDPRADYAVRIFSATREMPFAGHPTLGSAVAWLHCGGVPRAATCVVQECQIGLVEIDFTEAVPAFVAPVTSVAAMEEGTCARICTALGIARQDVLSAVQLDNGVMRNLLELRDAEAVLALDATAVSAPAFQGVSVLGRGGAADYEVRNLCPASLAPEDPVTGSLCAAIAVWLEAEGRLGDRCVLAQGTAMGREGRVFVRRDGARILIGGHTAIVIDGQVAL